MKHRRFLTSAVIVAMVLLALTAAVAANGPGPTDVGQAADTTLPPAADPTPPGPLPAFPDPPASTNDLPGGALGPASKSPSSGGFGFLPSATLPGPSGGCPGWFVSYDSSLTAAEPVETGRLFRDGVVSTCDYVKAVPALNDSNPRHYRAFGFTNGASYEKCYTANVVSTCPGNVYGLFLTTYLDGFVPTDPRANYLADEGASGLNNYSFVVPAGRDFYVVANEVIADEGCASFQFRLGSCSCWRSAIDDAIDTYTPTQTNRLYRDGVPSTCAANKAFPGPYTQANIHYRIYDFTNATSKWACYTVTASAPNCMNYANQIFVSAYTGTYDPSNMAINYLADGGSSPYPRQRFAFRVGPGQPFKVVVTSVATDDGVGTNGRCSAYSLDVSRCGNDICLPLEKH